MWRPLDADLSTPWVSCRSSPVFTGEVDPRLFISLETPADGFTRRSPFRARPPFTRPCRSFWSAFAELIWGQTTPIDFCNCTSTCGQPNYDSRSSQGRGPWSPSFSYRPRCISCETGGRRRAALRPFAVAPVLVPPELPRAFPTVMPLRMPHLRGLRRGA